MKTEIEELLKGIDCTCGCHHSCAIESVVIGNGAIEKLAPLISGYQKILLVADENTFATCGQRVLAQIGSKLESQYVFPGDTVLIPDERAIAKLQAVLSKQTDLIIGIGSGVIQDLCKYVSFNAGLPYFIVATAPSMDGYASKGAAMIIGNMKVTYNAHVPKAIIGDVDVLKEAPLDMIQSGYGDIVGKYSCLNDWKLAALIYGEDFCQYVYDLIYAMTERVAPLGQALLDRDPEAVATLMEAIVIIGIAMAYVGSSRPASGSEHHMSHYFEVIGIMKDEPYFMHGTDVLYSAYYTQKLRERILAEGDPQLYAEHDREKWIEKIHEVYYQAAEGVISLQDEMGRYVHDRRPVHQAKWAQIRGLLAEPPSSEKMLQYLHTIGLDIAEFEKTYGPEKIQNAIWYSKDLKDRYTVLWLYYDLFHAQG